MPAITAIAPLPTGRELALSAVADGSLVVRDDGTVWRVKHAGVPCEPRRAENVTRKGYLNLVLGVPGTRTTRSVPAHRIVYEVLVGPIPDGLQINHKDLNKANNHPSNLEAVTGAENIQHSYANGRKKPWTDAVAWRGKPRVSAEQKAQIRESRQAGHSISEIMAVHQLSKTHVWRIIKEAEHGVAA